MKAHDLGGPENITLFTPAALIAEDAGEKVVEQLLNAASSMGYKYRNNLQDITRLTRDGIDFANGESIAADLKIIFPNWKPHAFMKDLPICDEVGFVITGMDMRNPDYPEVFACGDAAALTVPKLGAIGHQECDVVGKQITKDVGPLSAAEAEVNGCPRSSALVTWGTGRLSIYTPTHGSVAIHRSCRWAESRIR